MQCLFAIETTFYYVKSLLNGWNFHIWLVFHLMKFKWLKSCGRFYFSCYVYCSRACNVQLKVFHNHKYEVQMLDKLIAWKSMKSTFSPDHKTSEMVCLKQIELHSAIYFLIVRLKCIKIKQRIIYFGNMVIKSKRDRTNDTGRLAIETCYQGINCWTLLLIQLSMFIGIHFAKSKPVCALYAGFGARFITPLCAFLNHKQ